MRILVVGASRGTGLALVEQALDRGHIVTALARTPGKLSLQHERLTFIKGDILDRLSVNPAVENQDAVCLSVGTPPTFKPVAVFSVGTQNVLDAMARHGARLLIAVTGVGAGDSKGHGGFLYDRIFLPLLLKKIYEDKDRQEEIIKSSGVNWVIVRPGFLTNGPRRGKYRVLTDLTGIKAGKISRADVAHFMLEELADKRHLASTPLLTY